MCTPSSSSSSSYSSSFSLLTNCLPLSLHHHRHPPLHHAFLTNSPFSFLTRHSLKLSSLNSSSPTSISNNTTLDHFSWSSLNDDDDPDNNFRGWDSSSSQIPVSNKHSGFPKLLVAGIATSAALLVAVISYFSLSKNGFRESIRNSISGSSNQQVLETQAPPESDENQTNEEGNGNGIEGDVSVDIESSDPVTETPTASEKNVPRVVTVTVDSNQQEAVNVLKKLKIIEEDVKAGELCSRREYARWLVRASSLLERNPKHRLTPAVALSGYVIPAYEDVTTGDQDFDSIQALAEAGVVSSKLSQKYYLHEGGTDFSPERFISRRDLIDWRAQLEYDFSVTGNQEILKTKLDLLDVREISSDNWPGLLMDMFAGDKSLLRRVFGQIRRLQPNKPSTVAEAAVALGSGRMTEAINDELLRIQAEESSRQDAKEEIKRELLDRGEIQKYWDEKIEVERARGLEVEQYYIEVINELEQEKAVQEGVFDGFLKEKAAMDCQKQLLSGLKEDVSEMSEKVASERAQQIAEEEAAQTLRFDLQAKKEGILDAKSLLEAEIEALRILRSWIEDEARKSQARWKVLEEVTRRWKWDSLE